MNDMTPWVGRGIDRLDGPLKVTGHAKYAAEFEPGNLCHAVMVRSTIASGRIVAIDAAHAGGMPGVILVMTHENTPQLPQKGRAAVNPPAGRELTLFQDTEIRYNGEPVALVVAETLEQAQEAAERVQVKYEAKEPILDFERAKRDAYKPEKMARSAPDAHWGDVERGLAEAEVRVDQVYTTPMEHHNPMEPHATIAHWEGPHLKLHDSTQYVAGVRETTAKTLGIPVEQVEVSSPFVGGGFGCKGSTWSHVVLAAMAARQVKRPVKLVVERRQMFGPVGGRPCTEQRVLLAARRDGTITALRHDVISHTSVFEDYTEPATQPTRALYGVANGAVTQRIARLNVGTPTFMRAPGESTGTFALECAMDELAQALGMDPVELRLRNHADADPSKGFPWSSKKLRECYADAARRFGWERRPREPGSLRDGRWLVGWGMATATYPAHMDKCKAVAMLESDGTYVVRCSTQDIGTGTYTIGAQVAAEALGVPLERVRFELGDSRFPRAPVSGGSMTAASVGMAVRNACLGLKEKVLAGERAPLSVELEYAPGGEDQRKLGMRSFGAVFTEVRVDRDLGILRVPRVVATYSVGRLLNAKTGINQLQGGIVWGIGMALLEESVLDPRRGRFANSDLAEYHVPVNADIGTIDVTVVDENDTAFNALGARGIGEIGITGVAGAISNAVHHATGKRIRDLPITLDKLL
ncbi:MAG TPA: xanthine dehydrogenase family protein molybdopterin-binding subunit [Usitatibacter sp.]|jgi:xanthine dehydrogenase YagR molybdenum-binding subunit|nr:xanthine dehydrogenase family protein molybdopterin-binding subunit [Usitatibacter sp.]